MAIRLVGEARGQRGEILFGLVEPFQFKERRRLQERRG
jgi:hypothetical protein